VRFLLKNGANRDAPYMGKTPTEILRDKQKILSSFATTIESPENLLFIDKVLKLLEGTD
jgi:hypothetical protein